MLIAFVISVQVVPFKYCHCTAISFVSTFFSNNAETISPTPIVPAIVASFASTGAVCAEYFVSPVVVFVTATRKILSTSASNTTYSSSVAPSISFQPSSVKYCHCGASPSPKSEPAFCALSVSPTFGTSPFIPRSPSIVISLTTAVTIVVGKEAIASTGPEPSVSTTTRIYVSLSVMERI